MSGVFINYRREDTAPYAGRIYDFLRRSFPNAKVFMDIDTIAPGEDFVEAINQTLAESRIVLAVIGPNWTKVTDTEGKRRLDNPDDYVVRELTAALESEARVIPVLVGGAAMPRTEALPARLQQLARRNAFEISDTRFIADAERLSGAIARVIDPAAAMDLAIQQPGNVRPDASSELTDALTIFKTLLWTGYALGLVWVFVQIGRAKEDERVAMLISAVLLLGLSAWFNVMLIRGKNWARMAYIALLAASVPAIIVGVKEQSAAEISMNVVGVLLTIWVIRLMFTEPIRRLFMGKVAGPR